MIFKEPSMIFKEAGSGLGRSHTFHWTLNAQLSSLKDAIPVWKETEIGWWDWDTPVHYRQTLSKASEQNFIRQWLQDLASG